MPKHYFNRLEYIDFLICTKSTGTPGLLSKKIGVSERTIFEYIDILKSLGGPILYCKIRQTYYYSWEGSFKFHFIKKKYIL